MMVGVGYSYGYQAHYDPTKTFDTNNGYITVIDTSLNLTLQYLTTTMGSRPKNLDSKIRIQIKWEREKRQKGRSWI